MNEFDITIDVDGMVRFGIRCKPGEAVLLPPELLPVLARRPQVARLTIERVPIPEDKVERLVAHARQDIASAMQALDQLP